MHLVFLLYALFASVFTASKQALVYTEPLFLVGSRMCIAGLLMLAYQYVKNRDSVSLRKGSIPKLLLLALFNIYLTNVFEFWGLQYLTSFKTCFIYSLSPFVSAYFSYLIFSESMTRQKWIGLMVGFLGFIPILLSHTHEEDMAGSLWIFSWAELAVMLAAVSSVYGWIVLKQLVQSEGYSPLVANGYSMLIGGALALFHSSLVENWNPLPVTDYLPLAELMLFLILVSNCICYNLYGFLLRRFSATFMAFAGLTTPLFSALFGWMFHGEVATLSFYVSFAIVFLGLFLYYMEELKAARKSRAAKLMTDRSEEIALQEIAFDEYKWGLAAKGWIGTARRRLAEFFGIAT